MIEITNEVEFESILNRSTLALAYFSSPSCNVCKVLKPKIIDLIKNTYSKAELIYINTEDFQKLAAQNQVFTIPTILIFSEGKEILRESRNINLGQFENKMDRLYNLIFS